MFFWFCSSISPQSEWGFFLRVNMVPWFETPSDAFGKFNLFKETYENMVVFFRFCLSPNGYLVVWDSRGTAQ